MVYTLSKMIKMLKPFTAFILTGCLAVTTVVCCCLGPAVMAHFHKAAVCSHCASPNSSHDHSSNPAGTCQYHLTNAEFSGAQPGPFSMAAPLFAPSSFLDKHMANFLPPFTAIYPRGSPPLTGSTPIYIQIRSLRI